MKSKFKFSCKPISKKDFNDWLAMAIKLWPDQKRGLRKTLSEILKSQKETAFICRLENKEPVGFANVSIRSDYVEGSETSPVGYLEGIFVEKKYRGDGIATKLVREGEKWAAKRGCKEMGSDVVLKNVKSQKFHQAIGFTEAEKIVTYIKKIERK